MPALALLAAAVLAVEHPPPASASAPLPRTASSYPFSAADHQKVPFDLGAHGYVESEHLVSGQARVFDWPEGAGGPRILGRGPYATRILVRRPRDPKRFNGTVIVEPLNPSADVDLPIMWAESHLQLIRDGYAWVGVTIKPNTIKALKRFDPARYASLAMANPRPDQTCAASAITSWSQPTTPADETGLAWDMLSQLGTLLKGRSAANPIPWPVRRLYMTGQSQTAGYSRTYATVFARYARTAAGGPLYDGYLYAGSPPWQVPLHQCRKDLEPSDPRLITPAVGVPVIELFTQGDMGTNVETRRDDSDAPADRFRRYEIAGAAHVDPWEDRSFASDEDMARAGMRQNAAIERTCQPTGVEPSDFPNRYVFDAAWRGLDRWVRLGKPPPRADRLRIKDGPFRPDASFETDADGNALGGVRSPTMDVPTARWIGAKTGPFTCLFQGYKYPFDAERLRRLYPTPGDYAGKVRASAQRLAAEEWLTPEDAAEIQRGAETAKATRPRVIVLTDIGNEPDDSESFVRFLLYANQFDVEALVATTSTWQRARVQPQLLRERIEAYAKVLPNLRRHAEGYPEPSALMAAVRSGSALYGMAGVGKGKDTEGSRRIVEVVDRADPRPVYVAIWGGAHDLAQALWTVRATRAPRQVRAFVAKLRVYSISDQDDAGPWARQSFPDLFWIASVHGWGQYGMAAWTGISADLHLKDKWPAAETVTNAWLERNIRKGPLGALYPPHQFIMEGDTPSFLGLIGNGLNDPEHPEYGGWGGRYLQAYEGGGHRADAQDRFVDADGRTWSSSQASIFRWRQAFQNDFAARMAWTLSPELAAANHNPQPVLNGEDGLQPVSLQARAGEEVRLSAAGSRDPDGDRLAFRWRQYAEPSNAPGRTAPELAIDGADTAEARITAPKVPQPVTYHVVLEVTDGGTPALTGYRRALITVTP